MSVASNLGTTVGPSAMGSILDLTQGNFTIAFVFLAVISLIIIAFSLGLKSGGSRSESR
ncbi:MAG: hypothetical protein AB7E31_11255 [Desulfitobacterium sp.]